MQESCERCALVVGCSVPGTWYALGAYSLQQYVSSQVYSP